jgi:hypothetical protein
MGSPPSPFAPAECGCKINKGCRVSARDIARGTRSVAPRSQSISWYRIVVW